MFFEASIFAKSLNYKKVELDFGVYYLFDNFFITEVNEGEHFDYPKLNMLLSSLRAHYGSHKRLAYIANRIHSYSIDPVLWSYFDEDDSILIAAAIVIYRDSTYLNANIEKQLASIPIKRAQSLNDALNWVSGLKEFN